MLRTDSPHTKPARRLLCGLLAVLLIGVPPAVADHDGDPVHDTGEEVLCGSLTQRGLVNTLPPEVASCASFDDLESGLWDGDVEVCDSGLCVRIRPTAKVDDIVKADADVEATDDHTVRVDRGAWTVTVEQDVEHVTAPVFVPRVDGTPSASLLNRTEGPITAVYDHRESCFGSTCQYELGADTDPSTPKVGELWDARLQVYFEGEDPSLDVPFTTVVWTHPDRVPGS